MLRITRQTDYGVMILTRIAQEGPARIHTARDLAAETEVPLPTVSKILKLLSRAELLVSQRGVKGGYRLARPAGAITVAEVIRAIEGPIAMTECVESSAGDCDKESWCPVRSNWQLINDAVEGALEGITLARMARPLEFLPAVRANGAAARHAGPTVGGGTRG
jgi:FeS assembly SUF system regulator